MKTGTTDVRGKKTKDGPTELLGSVEYPIYETVNEILALDEAKVLDLVNTQEKTRIMNEFRRDALDDGSLKQRDLKKILDLVPNDRVADFNEVIRSGSDAEILAFMATLAR